MSFEMFAFLGVMFGVILSLGVAALLTSIGTMLLRWDERRPYWVLAPPGSSAPASGSVYRDDERHCGTRDRDYS